MTSEERARRGMVDGMVRISCGLEDADDLISDLEQALRGADGNDTQILEAESEKGIDHAP
jgi:Cys/Met metabolism PLP-dependent enzyme